MEDRISYGDLCQIADIAVELFRPPYRGNCGIHLTEDDAVMQARMDALREALIKAGYSWEEWT